MDYTNWHVLQTVVGKEQDIKNTADSLFPNEFRLFLFTRDLYHTKKGNTVKRICPLFPGYIFIYGEVERFISKFRAKMPRVFVKPVCFNNRRPSTVHPEEIRFLLHSTGGTGRFPMSQGLLAKDGKVKIIRGPLKNLGGIIVFINRKKQKAKVKIFLFNREMEVSLGLEILEESDRKPSHKSRIIEGYKKCGCIGKLGLTNIFFNVRCIYI